jgi:lysophospholipid acyltransferase (LPLAT)-like uncharacterized protein
MRNRVERNRDIQPREDKNEDKLVEHDNYQMHEGQICSMWHPRVEFGSLARENQVSALHKKNKK